MFSLIATVLKFLLGLLNKGQSPQVQEGEKLGEAKAVVQIQEKSLEAVQKASDARDAVAAATERPDSLRAAIEADPNCRDR